MSDLIEIQQPRLIPVLEAAPWDISDSQSRPSQGPAKEFHVEWDNYWKLSLADIGITGVNPVSPGSWYAVISELSEDHLHRYLDAIFTKWGGVDDLIGLDSRPVLNGGLSLATDDLGVIIEPQCCGDLSDIANWQNAIAYRGDDWQMLWLGHPWISTKRQDSSLLVSEHHESNNPVAKWIVDNEELASALENAKLELLKASSLVEQFLVQSFPKEVSSELAKKLVGLMSY